ncbi:hypothetical protein ACFC08_08645 [Streptomyces sp. NPDC056112]|uniref:hypothetical protein n=1 Tax=Streptomyces sp. NPDC056112 TaxID=3345715 RepID=UPI0035D84BC8
MQATEQALQAFEENVRALTAPSDAEVFDSVKRVVLRLDAINEDDQHGGAGFCTEEREQLCESIDQTLSEHNIDVAAPAARSGIDRAEITDAWRDW